MAVTASQTAFGLDDLDSLEEDYAVFCGVSLNRNFFLTIRRGCGCGRRGTAEVRWPSHPVISGRTLST